MSDENPVVGNNLEQAQKSVEEARDLSLQARARGGIPFGGNLVLYMANAGELISPWWSRQRDIELDIFAKSSDHVTSATSLLISKIVSLPVHVVPRDPSVRTHIAQADEFTIRLCEESDFGAGWVDTMSKWLVDLWYSDNGGFLEIIGESGKVGAKAISRMSAKARRESGVIAGPIVGMPSGIAHLDSHRAQRTGDPEFPVLYYDTDGSCYKYHITRVAFASDMPSPRAEMLGIGFCPLSRCINTAQRLVDIGVYHQEKLGSRPKRAIIIAKRISGDVVLGAFKDAEEEMDNRGLRRFSMIPIIADLESDASLDLMELAGLPDNFDEETTTRLGMFLLAMAWGVPIRWIWPASVSGATKADAEFQHTSGLSGGLARTLRILEYMLGGSEWGPYHSKGKFLPPYLRLSLDVQDDWEDQQQADVKKTRADRRKTDLDDKVVTLRVAREQALDESDLTRTQFDQLELEDGRLPDGSDVLALFASPDNIMIQLLDLGFEEPLATGANDPFEMLTEIDAAAMGAQGVAATAGSATERQKAQQAIAALGALKKLYTPLVAQEVAAEVQPEPALPIVTAQKGFDFGVPAGEVIAGKLARGAGGRFVNVEELKEQIRQGIAQRLAARQAGGGKPSKAELKKQGNRAAVCEKLGVDPALVTGLLKMRSGGAPNTDALIAAKLAKRMADGSVVMSGAGRALLGAASSGDMDKATEALAKAKEETPEEKKTRLEGEREAKRIQREAERQAKQREREAKKAEAIAEREAKRAEVEAKREEAKRQREAERQEELEANRDEVEAALPDVGLGSLRDFDEGAELVESETENLRGYGLVERAKDGTLRMTSAGKAVLRAADRGRVRDAKDALSKAREGKKESADARRLAADLAVVEKEAERLTKALHTELDGEKAEMARLRLRRAQEKASWLRERLETSKGWLAETVDKVKSTVLGKRQEKPALPSGRPKEEDGQHIGMSVSTQCPLCGYIGATSYGEGHKGVLVCEGCKRSFDPSVE